MPGTKSQITAGMVNGVPVQVRDFDVRTNVEWGTSNLPRPDRAWSTTDKAGHFHAFSVTPDAERYPTLVAHTEDVSCDGSCGGVCEGEGSAVIRHRCRICQEEISPGLVTGVHRFPLYTQASWTARVVWPRETFARGLIGTAVSARFTADKGAWFGIAAATNAEIYGDTSEVLVTLRGAGPLGWCSP